MHRLTLEDFNYDLDESLIAQQPLGRRDESRLMVFHRPGGEVEHRRFGELPGLLRAGDLLVVNDTRVIPARFRCRRASGGRLEGLFLLERAPGQWEVLIKGAGRCRQGEELLLENTIGRCLATMENLGEGRWRVEVRPPAPAEEILAEAGATPLPPYIRRADTAAEGEDRQRYQTVFAARPGAVAAPTAGLHFTDEVLARLRERGIEIHPVTLHVGPGTFLPVKVRQIEQHRMHAEWYDLPAGTAEALNRAIRQERRIVAVGTTVVRVLETVAAAQGVGDGGMFAPVSGWTDIFIRPPYRFRAVGALVTNFHLPGSTLLMLVAALCRPETTDGVRLMLNAYAEAIRMRYRFFSYGDAMLID